MELNPKALAAWRDERGFTMEVLARLSETSRGYICDLESGRRKGSSRMIRRIASALQVDVRAIITDPNESPEAA